MRQELYGTYKKRCKVACGGMQREVQVDMALNNVISVRNSLATIAAETLLPDHAAKPTDKHAHKQSPVLFQFTTNMGAQSCFNIMTRWPQYKVDALTFFRKSFSKVSSLTWHFNNAYNIWLEHTWFSCRVQILWTSTLGLNTHACAASGSS
jgi:hypothetical protein